MNECEYCGQMLNNRKYKHYTTAHQQCIAVRRKRK